MTLKRLLIVVVVLAVLAGGGLLWLARVAYTPQGKARIIIAQLKGDTTSLHGWLLKHHVVRPGFVEPDQDKSVLACAVAVLGHIYAEDREIVAAAEMVKLGRDVLPIVIDALHDENKNVRMSAINVCVKFRDPAAIGPLADCMRDATVGASKAAGLDLLNYGLVQCWCRDSLVEIGPEAYGPLMEASRKCDPNLRGTIPGAIARHWGAAALPRLIELLEDSGALVRASAADELGAFKDARATDALIHHLGNHETDRWAATSVAIALRRIGDRKAIPVLLKTLRDTHVDKRVRMLAAGALAGLGQDEGLVYLLTMRASADSEDRECVAWALREACIKESLDTLLSMLGDGDYNVVHEVAQAIADNRDPRAVPALRKIVDGPESAARKGAAIALEMMGVKTSLASRPAKP